MKSPSDFPLRIVVMECPYDTWNDGLTPGLFARTMGLKLNGFCPEYDYGVLPVDTTDFVATHQLICKVEDDGSLIPWVGGRSITYERCQLHNLPFSALSLCRAAQAPEHERRVQEILQSALERGRTITYAGSWTIDPEVRQDRELTRKLRAIFTGVYVYFHQDYGIHEMICGGTIRFKADQYFAYWGMKPLSDAAGGVLPPIAVSALLGESVRIMHLSEFSQQALEDAKLWKLMWKNRLTISSPEQATRILAARKKAA